MRCGMIVTCGLLALLVATRSQAETEVASCDDVTYRGRGVLTADLDCTADPLLLSIESSGSLEFQGFTLVGATIGCNPAEGIEGGSCSIRGPGAFSGTIASNKKLRVSDLDITNGRLYGTHVKVQDTTMTGPYPGGPFACAVRLDQSFAASKLVVKDSLIDGANCAIDADGKVTLLRTEIIGGSGFAVRGTQSAGFKSDRVKIKDSTISGNDGDAVVGVAVSVSRSTISGNTGIAIDAGGGFSSFIPRARVSRSTVSGNGDGIILTADGFGTRGAKVARSTVTGNGLFGVFAESGTLRVGSGSDVTGNGVSTECGVSEDCADLASGEEPQVSSNASCGISYNINADVTWGVCSLD